MGKLEVSPGQRLRSCIRNAGITESEFANLAEIDRPTLSKYLNDKRKMSENFLFKAAKLLDTNLAYLKCEIDDDSPQRVIDWLEGDTEEEITKSARAMRCGAMAECLEALGITTEKYFYDHANNVEYLQHDNLLWYPVSGENHSGIDIMELEEIIRAHPGQCEVVIRVEYKNYVMEMDSIEYNSWLTRMVNKLEVALQDTFDLPYNLTPLPVPDELDMLMKQDED